MHRRRLDINIENCRVNIDFGKVGAKSPRRA